MGQRGLYEGCARKPPVTPPAPNPAPPSAQTGKIWGINTDPKNPTANPTAAALTGCGWVRFVFHVDAGTLDQAFAFYDPIIHSIASAGTKVLLILLQDTYWGNGPWSNGNWPIFYTGFAGVVGRIAQHYKGQVAAYEIWNEMDLSGQPTSIYIPPENYGPLIQVSTKAIRTSDPAAKVISGGLASADPVGYISAVKAACGGVLPFDAIGYHPYGQTPPNTTVFDWQKNTLSPAIQRLHNAFKMPIWITEIGVPRIDVNNQAFWPTIGTYMRNTFSLIHNTLSAICPVLIWFAWSDSQDNAGIVHNDQSHKGAIWDAFAANVKADASNPDEPPLPPPAPTTPPVVVDPPTGYRDLYGMSIAAFGPTDKFVASAQRMQASGHPYAAVTVVSDIELANKIAPYVKVPVFRQVWGDSSTEPYKPSALNGLTEAQAIQIGRDFYHGPHKEFNDRVPGMKYRCYTNEADWHPLDYAFYLGLMMESDLVDPAHKVVIFNDRVGQPEVNQWVARIPALRYGLAHGHLAGLNEYSRWVNDRPSNKPVSDPEGFEWYGGRHGTLYAAVPSDCWMDLLIKETGPSDATFRDAATFISDAKAYNLMLQKYPYVVGFCWYRFGPPGYDDFTSALVEYEGVIIQG